MESKKGNLKGYDFAMFADMVKKNKKHYLVAFGVSLILGVVVAFSIPKSYMAKTTLAPESSSEGNLGGSLSSLSSLVGLNMNGMNSDAIFPEIYPDVVMASDFLVNLSSIKVCSIDKKIQTSLYDYIENYQKQPWWSSVLGVFGKKKESLKKGEKLNYYHLTTKQSNIIKAIGDAVSCSVDQKTGVITIKATAQDPLIAASLTDSVSTRLQAFITNYRTNKARNDLANIKKLYVEAKRRYDKARQTYASFADANQELVLESYKAKESDLENEMQLQCNIYTQLTTQLQMARAKVIEKTPVYAILQPTTVPYRHSSPKKSIIVLAFLFVGCMGYTAYLMLKNNN